MVRPPGAGRGGNGCDAVARAPLLKRLECRVNVTDDRQFFVGLDHPDWAARPAGGERAGVAAIAFAIELKTEPCQMFDDGMAYRGTAGADTARECQLIHAAKRDRERTRMPCRPVAEMLHGKAAGIV